MAASGIADVERPIGDDNPSGRGMSARQRPLGGAHLAVQAAQRRIRIVLGDAPWQVVERRRKRECRRRHLAGAENGDAAKALLGKRRAPFAALHHTHAVGTQGAVDGAAVARDDKAGLHAPHAVNERQRSLEERPAA